ncbi:GerAB/ArcD/ProY family transporter [Paenibacillus sp. OV219]|uniref:GerAB/ArcD/ProY family transporter n=1 Tax=Paenibacillus sp. OV219 TaxID=1884377 RepID=UPI0008CE443C|nr:GerAB/ArcD/ProY family transporter [Paenibacillus sp. OV219]SEO88210.1 spore germination protein KB [Paenibacillus sp. OV219]
MKKTIENIGPLHLFAWVTLFELGTAVVIPVGMDAKQDAWIVTLSGCLIGMTFFSLVFGGLYRLYPDMPLTAYTRRIAGSFLGWLIGFGYLLYFMYIASRNIRDFIDLLTAAAYDATPMFALGAFMMVAVGYIISLGIEVFGRTAFIFFLLCCFVFMFIVALVLLSDLSDFHRIEPILGEGWRPIWSALLPTGLTFPFGEMVVMSMFLPYLNKKYKAVRITAGAMAFSAILLCIATFVNISVLGIEIASRSTFPLFTSLSRLRLAEIVQRLDSVVLFLLIITSFFKIGTFMFASVLAAQDLFKISNYKTLVMPIGVIVLLTSLTIAGNLTEHLKEGLKIVPYYMHLPMQFAIPVCLLLLGLIRRAFRRSRSASAAPSS